MDVRFSIAVFGIPERMPMVQVPEVPDAKRRCFGRENCEPNRCHGRDLTGVTSNVWPLVMTFMGKTWKHLIFT